MVEWYNSSMGILLVMVLLAWSASPASALTVDTSNRAAVVSFYHSGWLGSAGVASGWTGNPSLCDAGVVSSAYLDAATLRLNYFRALTGLTTDLVRDPSRSQGCQEAAEMMARNMMINHSPPLSWACYTPLGAAEARRTNLAIGPASLMDAIDLMILEEGVPSAGHRRWLLYRSLALPGFGAAFPAGVPGYAIDIFGSTTPPSTPEWTSWPPAGYVPYSHISEMWSFTYPGATLSGTVVTVTRNGTPLLVTLQPVQNGFGDATLVWTVAGFPLATAPSPEYAYHVIVANVTVGGAPRSFTYDVTPIDPDRVTAVELQGEAPTVELAPPYPSPSHEGASFAFTLTQESSVELTVRDITGRRIKGIASGTQSAGVHPVRWNGLDDHGMTAPAGLYFVHMVAGTRQLARRLVLIR